MKVIKEMFVNLFLLVFFCFALAMTFLLLNFNEYGLTQLGNKVWVLVSDEISSDKYEKGDLVIVEKRKIGTDKKSLKVGDEVFAYRMGADESVYIDIGVVGQIFEKENDIAFENGSTFDMKFIIGSPVEVYEDIGNLLMIVESKWGFLFIILVPCFLIFIYEIYALIVELKYGSDEE